MAEGKKNEKILVLVAGIALVAAAGVADMIGIGAAPGFGWRQIVSLIVGIGLVMWGIKGSACCAPDSKKS